MLGGWLADICGSVAPVVVVVGEGIMRHSMTPPDPPTFFLAVISQGAPAHTGRQQHRRWLIKLLAKLTLLHPASKALTLSVYSIQTCLIDKLTHVQTLATSFHRQHVTLKTSKMLGNAFLVQCVCGPIFGAGLFADGP